jgi:hypothetical protein
MELSYESRFGRNSKTQTWRSGLEQLPFFYSSSSLTSAPMPSEKHELQSKPLTRKDDIGELEQVTPRIENGGSSAKPGNPLVEICTLEDIFKERVNDEYHDIPDSDREKYCLFLFDSKEPPDPEFIPFVNRLHRSRKRRGSHREWTADENQMLKVIGTISLTMTNALLMINDRVLVTQLRNSLDPLFDAFNTIIDNYVDAK